LALGQGHHGRVRPDPRAAGPDLTGGPYPRDDQDGGDHTLPGPWNPA
jgi:hypothetical protein